MTAHITVTDTSTRAEIAAAIRDLRGRQKRAKVASVRAEVQDAIDELLDLYATARG